MFLFLVCLFLALCIWNVCLVSDICIRLWAEPYCPARCELIFVTAVLYCWAKKMMMMMMMMMYITSTLTMFLNLPASQRQRAIALQGRIVLAWVLCQMRAPYRPITS